MDEFETLLSKVQPAVARYVRFRLRDSSDWEDVLQEVYTLAYLRFSQLRDKGAFQSWILTIARNRCSEYYRKQGKSQVISLEEVPETVLLYGRQGITLQTVVEDTLELLSERDQDLLNLYYWQELSMNEIARKLRIPVGTVKSRLHTAKANFRKKYPYPPEGDKIMTKLPKMMPAYTIEAMDKLPYSCKWEELQGWFVVPRLGEKVTWGMYDFPECKRTSWCKMEVVGKAEVHGIEGVEVTAVQYGQGDERDPGFRDDQEQRFLAQLTDTHSRYLAESHWENGVRKCHTFLDGEVFLNNWGFGEDNCGNETNLTPKGLLRRSSNTVSAPSVREVLDVVGRYAVTINGKRYDTVCVMDVEFYNEAVVSEQYIDHNGRTVLWRRFNRDNWAIDCFGGKLWSDRLPDNERLIINGETYVHWYDCITDYIL